MGKKNEKQKKSEKRTHRKHRPPQASRVMCVRGFGEGAQGGAWGRRSRGWHRESVRQGLAMARVLRLLGARAHREARGLSGAEGRGRSTRSQGEKK